MNQDGIIDGDRWNYTPGVVTSLLTSEDGPHTLESERFAMSFYNWEDGDE